MGGRSGSSRGNSKQNGERRIRIEMVRMERMKTIEEIEARIGMREIRGRGSGERIRIRIAVPVMIRTARGIDGGVRGKKGSIDIGEGMMIEERGGGTEIDRDRGTEDGGEIMLSERERLRVIRV